MTREEFQAAIVQVLKVTHDVKAKVDGVDVTVKDIGDKINVAVDGTLIAVATRIRCSELHTTRRQGSESDDDGNQDSGARSGKLFARS